MTCQECQPLVIDLARGLPPFDVGGAMQRADVLSHVSTCKRCAQWLREQEALSDALRATAAADASLSAPARVEANVMAAFRARQTQQPHRPRRDHHPQPVLSFARPEPVVHLARPEQLARASRPSWPAGRAMGFAAAATIVIAALTMASLRWLHPAPPADGGISNPAGASAPSAAAATRGAAAATESASAPITSPTVTGTNAAVLEVLPDKGRKETKGRPAPPRARASGVTASRATSVARGASEFSGPAFVLLPYAEPLRPTEMRHIMRVRMTRAQFEAAELRAGGVEDSTVLADVLVGEDGTARAVRIVQ